MGNVHVCFLYLSWTGATAITKLERNPCETFNDR